MISKPLYASYRARLHSDPSILQILFFPLHRCPSRQTTTSGSLLLLVPAHPSFLRKEQSRWIAMNASLPDGFLLPKGTGMTGEQLLLLSDWPGIVLQSAQR